MSTNRKAVMLGGSMHSEVVPLSPQDDVLLVPGGDNGKLETEVYYHHTLVLTTGERISLYLHGTSTVPVVDRD